MTNQATRGPRSSEASAPELKMMTMRPYTRSLDPRDYEYLGHAEPLRGFEREMTARSIPHREWHPHRVWEYASMMQQLDELRVPKDAAIVDVGSGGSFFPPYLATVGGYRNLSLTDSMGYGDITKDVAIHRSHYGVVLPLYDLLVEDMAALPTDEFDVTMCISTIEHVAADKHDKGLRELHRITKPGGYLFITSDFFRDLWQFELSSSRGLHHTAYTKEFVLGLPHKIEAEFVGDTDLDYRGDFVHNYSFVNICLRKAA